MGIRWTKEEIQLLHQQLVQENLPLEKVIIPGRTANGIRRTALRRNWAEKQRHQALTEAQKARLRELKALNFSARKISEFDMLGLPHRTARAVEKYVSSQGLINKNKSAAAKNRKLWVNGEKQAFDNFLLENSKRLAPEQIAKMFGVKRSTVIVRQRFLKVKTSLAETIEIPHIREKIRKATQEKNLKTLLDFEKYVAEKEKKLEELAKEFLARKWLVKPQEKTCRICGKTWPKHKRFFFYRVYKGKERAFTSWYFWPDCVVCVAKQRHRQKVAKYEKKYSQKLE